MTLRDHRNMATEEEPNLAPLAEEAQPGPSRDCNTAFHSAEFAGEGEREKVWTAGVEPDLADLIKAAIEETKDLKKLQDTNEVDEETFLETLPEDCTYRITSKADRSIMPRKRDFSYLYQEFGKENYGGKDSQMFVKLITSDLEDHYKTKLLSLADGSYDGSYRRRFMGTGKDGAAGFRVPTEEEQSTYLSSV
ncbi:Hypp6685 [Branchiostoma lanceolatum]|uniref:Hypp6685 protein n=1 Tax=Branchiostoma lanceolatum TaxID=7740 RepID=A0A8K0EAJ6_BRALA|nr:Hypp6685 [Branchiostoma lanceolatum]